MSNYDNVSDVVSIPYRSGKVFIHPCGESDMDSQGDTSQSLIDQGRSSYASSSSWLKQSASMGLNPLQIREGLHTVLDLLMKIGRQIVSIPYRSGKVFIRRRLHWRRRGLRPRVSIPYRSGKVFIRWPYGPPLNLPMGGKVSIPYRSGKVFIPRFSDRLVPRRYIKSQSLIDQGRSSYPTARV